MRFLLTIFLCLQGWVLAAQNDFDVAIVGTGPVSMLEAIYHLSCGEKVLILESDQRCGGAWKSIDICGVEHADLGCHLIGSDSRLKDFFEKYYGCRFVCLEHPYQEADNSHLRCSNGFYFSGGCHELVLRLQTRITNSSNALLLNKQLLSIFIDNLRGFVELNLGDDRYTTSKLILTSASCFRVDNPSFINADFTKHPYNHLYMLIEDPTPSRFTYISGITGGMARAMNLTPFIKMPQEGLQLIVVQTYGVDGIQESQKFLDAFINQRLLTANARIVRLDSCVYNQSFMNVSNVQRLGGSLIEVLDSSSFAGMVRYIEKWKEAMDLIP